MKPKRFIYGTFPMNKCNLKCEYCYISHLPNYYAENKQKPLYSSEHIAKCLAPVRLGGVCLINLTGEGETMLQPDLVYLCRLLLEQGHCLEVVTNLTISKVVDEFLELPAILQGRLAFKVSFHYLELKRKNLLEQFWNNLGKIQKSDCSFSLELMSSDSQIEYIPSIMKECKAHTGAICHVTVGRKENTTAKDLLTDLSVLEYKNSWSVFESDLFHFKMELLGKKRCEFCYAGAWSLFLNMNSGEAKSCYGQPDGQNIFRDPLDPIRFHAVGHHCCQPYCFNGHSMLAVGLIPELQTPNYLDLRNRVRNDGSEWFHGEVKNFYASKLSETNSRFTKGQKACADFMWYARTFVYLLTHSKKTMGFLADRVKKKR